MDIRFSPHNTHLENAGSFHQTDPYLKRLLSLKMVYQYGLLDMLPMKQPGIYSISGGRQIGKTTLLKQYMATLLQQGADTENIAYFTGELIGDHHSLVQLLTQQLDGVSDGLCFLLLDEVSYIKDWDKGINFMADSGQLESVILMLAGSDSGFIRDATMRLPGRRGRADEQDFNQKNSSQLCCGVKNEEGDGLEGETTCPLPLIKSILSPLIPRSLLRGDSFVFCSAITLA